jgi:two-component system, cell cycle sensor histidine kinase and response regulator CckA
MSSILMEGMENTARIRVANQEEPSRRDLSRVLNEAGYDLLEVTEGREELAESRLLKSLVRGTPLREWLAELCRSYEVLHPSALCSALLLIDCQLRSGAGPSLPEAYNNAVDGVVPGEAVGSCGTAAHRGEAVIVGDIANDPLWKDFSGLAEAHDLAACWSIPIIGSPGEVLGTFAVYYQQPREPEPNERTRLRNWADLAALAIERERAEAVVRDSEKRFRTVVDAVPDLIFIKDCDGRFLACNHALADALGADGVQAITGRTAADFHPADKANLYAADDRAVIRDGHPILNREEEHSQANGTTHLLLTNKIPLRDSDGKVVGLVGVARDITQTRQLEEQLRQSQKMEAIGQLAGGVAHDFNNLLTALIGQTELCQMTEGLPSDVIEGLREIRISADRAAALTRQLLLFSRKQIMQKRVLDLNEIVSRHSRLLHRIIGEDVQLELRLFSVPLMVNADETMVNQVLLNLGVNARDAMPDGGRLIVETDTLQLADAQTELFSAARPGRYARLRVSDSGCGIEPTERARIFEPFFTTKEVGKGTGLGLATAFGIIQQHNGGIRVESEIGQGARFEILLPLEEETTAAPAGGPVRQPKAEGGTETILLTEDDPHVRRMCRRILDSGGYRVLHAMDGVEARKLWEKHGEEMNLLVTDLVMPGGASGHQLAEQLREDRPQLKVIYISGYSREIAGRDLELRPGENFLSKPFTPSELLQTVRSCLDA